MTDLITRLRAIPVWMVRDMAPGWQEHGTTAYDAANRIDALEAALNEVHFLCARIRDLDEGSMSEETANDLHGHVLPSVARMEYLVAALSPSGGEAA